MHIDPASLRGRHVYQLLISMIQPRPIAWVGSRSAAGVDNLAPFSYFMGVSSSPPALAISVARKGRDALKDTARNILDTGVFTVSIPSEDHVAAVAGSATSYPAGRSEFAALGLEAREGQVVAAPYPAVARATAECELWHANDLGTVHLLVGRIVAFHIDDALVERGSEGQPRIDGAALAPLARLGGATYGTVGRRFPHPTPAVPDDEA